MLRSWGIAGYVGAIVVVTSSYAFFQAANDTAIITGTSREQRDLISGLLNLSRNLGLILAVACAKSAPITAAPVRPKAVAAGMRVTFRGVSDCGANAFGLCISDVVRLSAL